MNVAGRALVAAAGAVWLWVRYPEAAKQRAETARWLNEDRARAREGRPD